MTSMVMEAVLLGIGAGVLFEDFYDREHARVFRAVLAFCGDRVVAEDATQEAFVKAFVRWRRLRAEDWAAGWVMATAMNQSRRSSRKVRHSLLSSRDTPGPTGDRVDLARALLSLPERQRQAVILFHVADHPLSVVAELMALSEGAVKSHLGRARKALRAPLEVKHD